MKICTNSNKINTVTVTEDGGGGGGRLRFAGFVCNSGGSDFTAAERRKNGGGREEFEVLYGVCVITALVVRGGVPLNLAVIGNGREILVTEKKQKME
ncbi:hypothetical protein M5689_016496 [Euphorbia peplus]|nr:hypothetical protein M5689_016496 [Euphorbia peplus]